MRKSAENKASMLKGVEGLLEENSALLSSIPIFGNVKNEFVSLNKQLEVRMKEQMTNVAAYTMDKDNKRELLIRAILDEATKVTYVAVDTQNVNMGRQARITRSELLRKRDRLLLVVGKNLYDLINANLAILAPGGISAASQADFKKRIDEYDEAIDDKSIAALTRAAGTRGIDEVLKKAMSYLKLVRGTVALAGVEELNLKLADASRIDKVGVRHYTVKGVVRDELEAGVYKALVTLTGKNGKGHSVYSDKHGVFHLKSLGEDVYRMVVSHEGFVDWTREVELMKGEVVEVDVVLVK